MKIKKVLHTIVLFIIFYLPITNTAVQANSFYWIGGSGNWSDTLHWQSPNGGIPKASDNVFFNASSFTGPNQVVIIDEPAFCLSMDWSNALFQPGLSGNADLSIAGSLILCQNMTIDYSGSLEFMANGASYLIDVKNNILNSDISFTGTASWMLLNDLDINLNDFSLQNGTLDLNKKTLQCGSFYSVSTFNRTLKAFGSSIYIRGLNPDWEVNAQFNFLSENSIITFDHANFQSVANFKGGNKKYGNVVFKNNAILQGNNIFQNLILSPGQTYQFTSGNTQEILGALKARGCSGLIEILATGANQAYISKSNGNIEISFVMLRSMSAIMAGTYQFTAYHSIDNGNNANINIPFESRDMEWRNGTGLWTDTIHWTSQPIDEDADCLPLPYDNVSFTDNSFYGQDTVLLNISDPVVHHMTWINTIPAILDNITSTSGFRIFGSLEFSAAMQNSFNGPFIFSDSLGGKTIKTNGIEFKNNVVFDAENGGYTVLDSVKITGEIKYKRGALNLDGNYLECAKFYSDSAWIREFNISDSYIKLTSTQWHMNVENLELESDNSTIELIASGGRVYNFGEDTVQYHNILFSGLVNTGWIYTYPETYGIFHKAEFLSNGAILSNNTFDSLSFSPGNYYDFGSGCTQTINNYISPTGVCDGPILIKAYTNGVPANIKKLEDTITVYNTAIRDIHVNGGAVFLAENSVDLGNNEGWDTIVETAPGKLFWVGGEGNWSDKDHWSLTSNGPGGECIPTPMDTVIFDQNSFDDFGQSVTVDLNNAFAHNIDWSQIGYLPEFASVHDLSYLRIYGSLKLHPYLFFTFSGPISFEASNPGQFITTDNIRFHNKNNDVFFDGIGGEWSLNDTLSLGLSDINRNSLYFANGSIITQSQFIDCYSFISRMNSVRKFEPGNSKIHINNEWYSYGLNLELNQNSSFIQIDSGNFIHRYGNHFSFNDLTFSGHSDFQNMQIYSADSVFFNQIIYHPHGEMIGENGSVYAHNVEFKQNGKINTINSDVVNVVTIDSLQFYSLGSVFGNDTIRNYVQFDSVAEMDGNSIVKNAYLKNDGFINGFNSFDTLTFSPRYDYIMQSGDSTIIVDEFNIVGNNCEFVGLYASSAEFAEIYMNEGFVAGELIEMSTIRATGGATFDAGYFSINLNDSNEGWIFHNSPFNYNLGDDISMLEGDTIYVCASTFNGNSSTSYQWSNCETGQVLGNDSCLMVTTRGNYCLSVFYNEGPGCEKSDEIFIGCHLGLLLDTTQISCYGFDDGAIEVNIQVGTEPIEFIWYKDGQFYSDEKDISGLTTGFYVYNISDAESCVSIDTVEIVQPDELSMDAEVNMACFGMSNGLIELEVNGGTGPYKYSWSNGENGPVNPNLPPDEYSVSVTDDNLCPEISDTYEVGEYEAFQIDFIPVDLQCFNNFSGSIDIQNITGGTGQYEQYQWYFDNQFFSTEPTISNINAGEYTLVVIDDFGCNGESNVEINQPDDIVLTLTPGLDGINQLGLITLEVEGGTLPYSYLWNTGAVTKDIDPLGGGTYFVEVTDGNQCKATESIFIEVHYRVFAPTAFSPNGDGVNDDFGLIGLGTDLREFDLTVFNRYGAIVFESTDPNILWNGTINNQGDPCPIEVYTWQVKLSYFGGEETIVEKGNLTLLR